MNRRSFVSGLLGLGAGVAAGVRRLTPDWCFLNIPVGWTVLPGRKRIVRQATAIEGQQEACLSCGGPRVLHVGPEWGPDCTVGRTPVPGSVEMAHLEYMATHHPQRHTYSETNTLRRLESGELAVDDVYIRLVSAEEIDAPGSPYAGSRDEAFAEWITVLA